MNDMAQQMARMQSYMALNSRLVKLKMEAMPAVARAGTADGLKGLITAYEQLLSELSDADTLVTPAMVNEQIAEATEWVGRTYMSLEQADRALPYLERAQRLHEGRGATDTARKLGDLIGDVRVVEGGDIDEEIRRLIQRLDETPNAGRERAALLIQLGEVKHQTGDDYGAVERLDEAEEILSRKEYQLPDANDLLGALGDALGSMSGGGTPTAMQQPGDALELRALHKRLYTAFVSAYGSFDPERAKKYQRRIDEMGGHQPSDASKEDLMRMVRDFLK